MLAIIIIIAKPLRKAIKQQKSLCLESCPHIGLAKKFEFFYDVMGREVGGGSCLGTHVRIKDFKIKKKKKEQNGKD